MLVRQAHEIEWVRKHYKAISPIEFENKIIKLCSNEKLTFLGFIDEWKGRDTKTKIKCHCGTEWQVSVHNLLNHGRRCPACKLDTLRIKNSFHIDYYMDKVNLICKEENISFYGIVGEINASRTKIKLSCSHGHEWTTTINQFVNSGTRCKICAYIKNGEQKRHSKLYRLKQITQVCELEKLEFLGFVDTWKGNTTNIKIKCHCGHNWNLSLNNFINHNRRCPSCSKHGYQVLKPGTLYIQKLTNEDSFVCVKFGITNKETHERMRNQSRVSKFDHEIFYELTLQDGQKILDLENKIKEAMKGKTSYISKEDMPDGYTETVAPSELSTIMYIVKTFEKELTA